MSDSNPFNNGLTSQIPSFRSIYVQTCSVGLLRMLGACLKSTSSKKLVNSERRSSVLLGGNFLQIFNQNLFYFLTTAKGFL
jgi:hypothetical protein